MTGETVTEGPAGFEVAHGRLTVERIYLRVCVNFVGSQDHFRSVAGHAAPVWL